MQDLIVKAATLLEALPYIQKFSGATFVVKYGGSFIQESACQYRQREVSLSHECGIGRSLGCDT